MSGKIGVYTKEIAMPFQPELGPTISISSYLAEILGFEDCIVSANGQVLIYKDLVLGRLARLTERIEAL